MIALLMELQLASRVSNQIGWNWIKYCWTIIGLLARIWRNVLRSERVWRLHTAHIHLVGVRLARRLVTGAHVA